MDIIVASGSCCARPNPLMKPSRPLTAIDTHIWQTVARTVRPLHSKPIKGGRPQEAHMHFPPPPSPILHHSAADVQIRKDKKVRKGKIGIDKKIDLHDLTRDQAFPMLTRGLLRAYNSGARCVLVVTGKGANLEGVLRKSLPAWLTDDHIRPVISGFAPAHIRHGGGGAFYVFLKRKIV